MGDALGGAAGGAIGASALQSAADTSLGPIGSTGFDVPGGIGGNTFVEGAVPPGGYGGGIDMALGTQRFVQQLLDNVMQSGGGGGQHPLAPRPPQAMQLQQQLASQSGLPNLQSLMPPLLGRPGGMPKQ